MNVKWLKIIKFFIISLYVGKKIREDGLNSARRKFDRNKDDHLLAFSVNYADEGAANIEERAKYLANHMDHMIMKGIEYMIEIYQEWELYYFSSEITSPSFWDTPMSLVEKQKNGDVQVLSNFVEQKGNRNW